LEGATIVLNGRREPPLRAAAEEISNAGGTSHVISADVSLSAGANRVIEETLATFGHLDILVNNAGAVVSRAPAHECSDEDWSRTLQANLSLVFHCSKAALPALRAVRGSIVNIASVAGAKGSPSLTAYAAAKAGVINLTKTMALDYAADGIRVNAICPAYIETDLTREYLAELRRTDAYAALVAKHPLGLGRPDDVAWAALYLASDEARWVTGVALPVDGGLLAGC
jgi:meso-butanediol dehydrogenase/(S,S)-butanediol dehydrogenase/diacetyl reductase